MCRNIRTLYNYEPPASEMELHEAALQYIRKISGFHQPSKVNEAAFNVAVYEVAEASARLLGSLESTAMPKNREAVAAKAHGQAIRRFGKADAP